MNKYIKYTMIAAIILVIILALVILNINKRTRDNVNNGKTKIVTSFYPIYIIAQNLTQGADNIELVNMADVNVGCLHDYTLKAEDIKKIENADIFISNGLGMEKFLDKIISANTDMYIIDSSKDIQNIIKDENEINAHVWTNIDNYITQVRSISEELQEKDSVNSSIYQKNEEEYVGKLVELKDKTLEELKDLKGKKVIILNEAFEYLAQELNMDATIIKSDHEESTLSADKLKDIIDKVKKENIQIIIIDKNDNKSNAETIANETGAKIYELNSGLTGNLDKDAYIKAIEENLEILK